MHEDIVLDHLITFPVFLDMWDGFGVDKDKLGFVVVFGNEEKYAFTPQRYDTFIDAANSILSDLKVKTAECWKCSKTVKIRKDGLLQKHNISRAYRSQRMPLNACPASLTKPQ